MINDELIEARNALARAEDELNRYQRKLRLVETSHQSPPGATKAHRASVLSAMRRVTACETIVARLKRQELTER